MRDGSIRKNLIGYWVSGLLLTIVFYPAWADAANLFSLTTMNDVFDNIRRHELEIIRLVVAVAYIMGICFVFGALHHLKKVGRTMGTMMGGQEQMTGPLVKMIFGILLIYLPSTVNMGVQTVWGSNSSILSYSSVATDNFAGIKGGMIVLMRVVGYVSLIKGLVVMSHSASGHANPGQGGAGKGIVNMVGGILAINVVATIRLVGSVLGIDLI